MKITNLEETSKTAMDMEGAKNVFKQVPLSLNDGAPNFVFRVFSVEPEGHTPYHQHPFEHLIYVLEGNGVLVSENKENPVQQGNFLLVLPDEMHQLKNVSDSDTFKFICAVPKDYE
jgi:quercetin dioxygenase-like cupin family protein